MSIFELLFLVVLLVLIVFLSKALAYLLGISAWYFAIPLLVLSWVAFQKFGMWLAQRRHAHKWPFDSRNSRKEK